MVLTLLLVSLQVLSAMFLTLACSRQCRIDIVHTFSSIITPRPVWTRFGGRLWLTFGMKPRLSSAEVARAFILAYRVMRLIIQENGNNSWLSHGTPHCNVRKDYHDTSTGVVPKNGNDRFHI
jgi:hypothetical protein